MRRYNLTYIAMWHKFYIEGDSNDLIGLIKCLHKLKLPYVKEYDDWLVHEGKLWIVLDQRTEVTDRQELVKYIKEFYQYQRIITIPKHYRKLMTFLPDGEKPRASWHRSEL